MLVGENGCGKSTFLEALAAGAGLPAIGRADAGRDESLAGPRRWARRLTLAWSHRTHRGFFLRAEDFFNFSRRIARNVRELEEAAEGFDRTLTGYGRRLAAGTLRAQARALRDRYDGDLDARSHGESFLTLFRSRLVPDGFYLLDEPEAPLSPQRQLALLAILMEEAGRGSQFVIATHSPILMACPGAAILDFDRVPPRPAAFADLKHVTLTRNFLADPERYLRHLKPS